VEEFMLVSFSRLSCGVSFLLYLVLWFSLVAESGAAPVRFWVDGNLRGVLDLPHGKAAHSQALKRQALKQEHRPWLFSTGNVLGPATESYADGGAPVLTLMNMLPYDAMVIGPMDFFRGTESLLTILAQANFPVVATNLRPREGQKELTERWKVVRPWVRLERDGESVLVLGLYSPEGSSYGPELDPQLQALPIRETLDALQDVRRPEDRVVAMGDLSFKQARKIFRDHPWIDLIFLNQNSGDSEQFASSFDHGFPGGQRLIWIPFFGNYLAEVESFLEPRRRSFAEMLPIKETGPGDPEALEVVEARMNREDEAELSVLARLDPWEVENFHKTIANALRVELRAEIGLIRKGTIRATKAPARFTRSALRSVYPFTDRVRLLRVEGKKLRALWKVRNQSSDPFRHLIFSGLKEVKGKLLVNGRRLDNYQTYRLATVGKLLEKGVGIFGAKRRGRVGPKAFDILVRYFTHPGSRHQRTRRAKHRVITRRHTTIDFSRRESVFAGSAPDYQLKIPGRANLSSDIPGLVGREFVSAAFNLNHRSTVDRPGHDLILDLDARYSVWNSTTVNEFLDMDLRYERKDPLSSGPKLYAEMTLNTVLFDQGIPNRERPLFVKSSVGLVWKPAGATKVYSGLGNIKRFSQPGNPGSFGLDFGYEWKRETWRGVTLRSTLDAFVSGDSDKVRTGDFMLELRVKIGGPLSTVLRQRTFSWKDATVASRAVRNESFIGISLDSKGRHY
jgi:hypothetical protein